MVHCHTHRATLERELDMPGLRRNVSHGARTGSPLSVICPRAEGPGIRALPVVENTAILNGATYSCAALCKSPPIPFFFEGCKEIRLVGCMVI